MIALRDVSMAFGEKVIFDKLNLSFSSPGMYAVLGPSGRGKTTLLRLIAGLEPPQSGSIKMPQDCRIAFCFQEDRLLPFKTVLENVMLATPSAGSADSSLRREPQAASHTKGAPASLLREGDHPKDGGRSSLARYWLARVGLAGEENSYPASLSGGMKRRASLARALAYDAPVLLMDEPFRALDEETHAAMLRLVREAAKDKLLLLVTHDESDCEGMQIIRL